MRRGGSVATWAIQTLQAVAVAAALALVYLACRVQSAALPAMAILVLGFFVLEPRVIPRPHLASFAGIAACCWLIQRAIAARSARPLWWVVPMVALWSNLHLECVFGVALIGLFALAELARPSALARREALRALTVAASAAAAMLANPYGWGLFQYLFENATVPQILSIAELRPSLPSGLPRVLRLRGRRGAAVVVAAAPARAVGSARVRPLRCARLPISPAHAPRLSCHGADARVAADDLVRPAASTAGRRSRRRSRRPCFCPASR